MLRVLRSSKLRYLMVGIAAFMLGSATVGAAAATAPGLLGTIFYTTQINGVSTQPCTTTTTGTAGPTTVCNAIVDSNGNLHVTGTTSVNGTVTVGNFPATQDVNVVGGSTAPVAERSLHAFGNVAPGQSFSFVASIKVAYAQLVALTPDQCNNAASWQFVLPNGETAGYTAGSLTFPIPIDITQVQFINNGYSPVCPMAVQLVGY